ncbi:BatD family protein [Oceaniferula marina]|uniref:BatD family protein n=1 Tax=Oceaniferula marina TaxID=2748318 RepID=UPI001D040B94|nr:BatD family protein [Oceaniferula marina]
MKHLSKLISSSLLILMLLGVPNLHGKQPTASSFTPYAEASINSRHLVPGEQTYLSVRLHGAEIDNRPLTPVIPDTAVNFVRSVSYIDSQRQIRTSFLFRLTPIKPGKYTIPRIALRSGAVTYQTPTLPFTVYPTEHLTPLDSGIGKHQILAGWFAGKKTLYEGERCPVTLKIYVPQQLPVATNGWGLPDPEKKNCLAWRFSLPDTRNNTQVTIDGISYLASSFDTTLSGITPGKADFGPAPIRIVVRRSILDPLRGSILVNFPIELSIPSIEFTILPLPDGAPKSFRGAIGRFTLASYCSQTELSEDEPTEIILRIQGRGNLEAVKAPELAQPTWKIIDSSKVTRGEERRLIQGTLTYRQLLRPRRADNGSLPSTIPPHTLSYFDPDRASYHTLRTAPIPVSITPTAGNMLNQATNNKRAEKLGTPPEEMRGILSFIDRPRHPSTAAGLMRHWQLIPAGLLTILLLIPAWKRIRAHRIQHPDTITKQQALADLASTNTRSEFFRLAGHFVERWRPSPTEMTQPNATAPSEKQIQHILEQRDQLCFLPSPSTTDDISQEEKHAVIKHLKAFSKLSIMLLSLTIALSSQLIASESKARDAWKSGKYQQAITIYQDLYPDPNNTPADVLFNIGNCHHRLNHPGQACLAWRRALIASPRHQAARQNLRYVELEKQSIVPQYRPWQFYLTAMNPSSYITITHASLWLAALSLASLFALRSRIKIKTLCITLLVITPVSAALGFFATRAYPDDRRFAQPEQQALVLQDTHLYRQAHRVETQPRQLPTASLLRVEARRGPWLHVSLADGTSGWVQSKDAEALLPKI